MNMFLKHFLINLGGEVLGYSYDEFIDTDFAKQYDEAMLLELTLVNLTLALANGIEQQEINNECIRKVIGLLRAYNVDLAKIDISQCCISVNDFIINFEEFVKYEYDFRYRVMEALLFIFYYNGKNIKKYQALIKIAVFLELRRKDFIYLTDKYKGVKV